MSGRGKRIAQLIEDEDFSAVVEAYRDRLTKEVMSAATSVEDREKALTKYHALDGVLKGLLSEAQNIEKE